MPSEGIASSNSYNCRQSSMKKLIAPDFPPHSQDISRSKNLWYVWHILFKVSSQTFFVFSPRRIYMISTKSKQLQNLQLRQPLCSLTTVTVKGTNNLYRWFRPEGCCDGIKIKVGQELDKSRFSLNPKKKGQPPKQLTPSFHWDLMVPRDRIELPTRGFSVTTSEFPNLLILL